MQSSYRCEARKLARQLTNLTDLVYQSETGTVDDLDHLMNSVIETVREHGMDFKEVTLLDSLINKNGPQQSVFKDKTAAEMIEIAKNKETLESTIPDTDSS